MRGWATFALAPPFGRRDIARTSVRIFGGTVRVSSRTCPSAQNTAASLQAQFSDGDGSRHANAVPSRKNTPMRYVLSLVFLALAAACGFGLLASFEPGAG